jgi:hypothetical protein
MFITTANNAYINVYKLSGQFIWNTSIFMSSSYAVVGCFYYKPSNIIIFASKYYNTSRIFSLSGLNLRYKELLINGPAICDFTFYSNNKYVVV